MKRVALVFGGIVIAIDIIVCASIQTQVSQGEGDAQAKLMVINETIEHEGLLNMYYQLLGRYDFDDAGLRRHYGVREGYPLTFFMQMRKLEMYSAEYLEQFYPDCGFVLPDFGVDNNDYPDMYFAVTIGKEIIEMKYEYFGEPYPPNHIARGFITFAEVYHDNTLFFYVTDGIFLGPDADLGEYYFYTVKGEEKIFEGEYLGDVNSFNEAYKKGIRDSYGRMQNDTGEGT